MHGATIKIEIGKFGEEGTNKRSAFNSVILFVMSHRYESRMCVFLNISVLQGGVVSTSPNPQAGGQPIVSCP